MPGERTSVYLAADLAAAVKASGATLAELIRRGLAIATAEAAPPAPSPSASSLATIPGGKPSPGVVCMGPGCWQRDTARYGLGRLVLRAVAPEWLLMAAAFMTAYTLLTKCTG